MQNYKEFYFMLFAAVANAVEALEAQNYGMAKNLLIEAQQKAEEKYINEE